MLQKNHIPFLIAANKIDSLYDWSCNIKNQCLKYVIKKQKKPTFDHLMKCLTNIKNQLQEHGFNSEIYSNNKNLRKYVSIIPISAKTGEGIPDLVMLINKLTTTFLKRKLTKK